MRAKGARVVGLLTAATVAAALLVRGGPLVSGTLFSLLGVGALTVMLVGLIRGPQGQRVGLGLLALGLAITVSGDALWFYLDMSGSTPGAASVADVVYLPAYLAYGAGLWSIGRQRWGQDGSGALLDAALVTTGASLLAWAFVIAPQFSGGLPVGSAVVPILYPVADLFLLVLLLAIAFSGVRSPRLTLLLAGMGVYLATDAAYATEILDSGQLSSGLLDVTWLGAYWLIALAAWAQAPSDAEPHASHQPVPLTGPRLVVLACALLIVPLLLGLRGQQDLDVSDRALAASAALLTVLVVTRMSLLVRLLDHQARALQQLSRTDPLTGAVNRRGFAERLQLEMQRAARLQQPFALALIDIDNFKQYNDSAGHQAGDEILRTAAETWQPLLREIDVLARVGGDEFAVVLPDCDASSALGVLERLRLALPSALTCSLGLAVWAPDDTADGLVARADRNLYQAKRDGRNRVVHDPGKPLTTV